MKSAAFCLHFVVLFSLLLCLEESALGQDESVVKFAPPDGAKVTSEIESSLVMTKDEGVQVTINVKATVEWTARSASAGSCSIFARLVRLDLSYAREEKKEEGKKSVQLSLNWSPRRDLSLLKDIQELQDLCFFLRNPLECRVDRSGNFVESPHVVPYVALPMGWVFKDEECPHFAGVGFSLPKVLSEWKRVELKEGAILFKAEENIPEVIASSGTAKVTAMADGELTVLIEGKSILGPKAADYSMSLPTFPDKDLHMELCWDTAKNLPRSFQGSATVGLYDASKKVGTLKQEYKVKNSY